MVMATNSVQAARLPQDPERPLSGTGLSTDQNVGLSDPCTAWSKASLCWGAAGRGNARAFVGLVMAAAVLVTSGCSSMGKNEMPGAAGSEPTQLAWFRARPAPDGWKTMELPDGTAVLSIPPDSSPVESDAGSVSAAITAQNGDFLIYLNATPRQGDESQAKWPQFRLDHLTGEHAASATRIASRGALAFRGGTGSCLTDSYVTSVGAHEYLEIACLVDGSRGSSVLVVAAPAGLWDRYSPVLEQAVDSYLAE